MIFFPTLLCTILIAPLAQSSEPDDRMPGDGIPLPTSKNERDYEFVPVKHSFHKRNVDGRFMEFTVYNQDIKLHLKPSEEVLVRSNTPVWTARRSRQDPNFLEYTKIENAMDGIETYYSVGPNKASISVFKDRQGNMKINGIINSQIHVESSDKIRNRRGLHEGVTWMNFTTVGGSAHNVPQNTYRNYSVTWSIPSIQRISSKSQDSLDIVYPEILVFVDSSLYLRYNGNLKAALSYIVTFWGGVDLRFRDSTNPRVRLNIAGIVLFEEWPSFLKKAPVMENGRFTRKLDMGAVLEDFGDQLYRDSPVQFGTKYDVGFFMTGYDLVGDELTFKFSERVAIFGTLGNSFMARACYASRKLKRVLAVAVVEDTLNFKSILAAAHELGHVFGAPHDGYPPDPEIGGPGAVNCPWYEENGHLMSYNGTAEKKIRFSRCSHESMRHFFNERIASCLRNVPANKHATDIPRILPGKYMSLDEQCWNAGFIGHDILTVGKTVCTKLTCTERSGDGKLNSITIGVAAEGSPCGVGKYCLNAFCVPETSKK